MTQLDAFPAAAPTAAHLYTLMIIEKKTFRCILCVYVGGCGCRELHVFVPLIRRPPHPFSGNLPEFTLKMGFREGKSF
jgi:hypothetical protein